MTHEPTPGTATQPARTSHGKLGAAMEAESRTWMAQCPYCGYQRSWWEIGGVMYKAAGTSRKLLRCPNCGRMTWHRVYRDLSAPPAGVAPLPAGGARLPRPLLWVLGISVPVIALVAFLIILFSVLGSALQPVITSGDSFMSALKTADYNQAYALCTPDLQKELKSVSGLGSLVQAHQPASWSWSNRSVRNGIGYLDGTLTYANGKKGDVHLVLQQIGGDWRISSFRMIPS